MEWAKFQERERKKEEEEKEKERVAYAQIDWHDFVVVETVDFQPNEQGKSVTPDGEPVERVDRWAYDKGHLRRPPFDSGSPSPRELPSPYHPGGAGGSNPHSGAL